MDDLVLSLNQLFPLLTVLAEGEVKPPGWDSFAQYSVLGLGVLGFGFLFYRIFMQLWARSSAELAREVARADRLEAEGKALNLVIQDKALPTLFAVADVLTKCTELLQDQQRDRDYALRRRDRDGDAH